MRRIAIFAVSLVMFAIGPASLSCTIGIMIWGINSQSADPMFLFVRGKKAGYIDTSGRILIKPSLPHLHNGGGEFHEGLLGVRAKRGSRLIDRTGTTVALSEAESVHAFSEGLASALIDWGKVGFIDRTGRFVVPPQFYWASSFSEGLAKVSLGSEPGTTGYIDRVGKFAIPPRLGYGWDFHEGVAAAVLDSRCAISNGGSCGRPEFKPMPAGADSECRYSYIDKTGKPIFHWRFEDAKDFSEGLAAVRVGRKWGFVNKRGEMAIAAQFDYADPFSEGLASVWKDEKSSFIDHSGKVVITLQDGRAESFSDERALISGAGRRGESTYWYIDRSGKRAFPGNFDFATSFVHGRAHVKYRFEDRPAGSFAWIDPSGKAVFTYSER